MKLGIRPSGNKYTDQARLIQEKQKIEEQLKANYNNQTQTTATISEIIEREQLERQKPGATVLAEINKILLGL